MDRPPEGYGIAGHKNTYSSHVKTGNDWNEDRFGAERATTMGREPVRFTAKSEAQERFANPRKVQAKKCPFPTERTWLDEPTADVAGMPHRLLFAHGPDAADTSKQRSDQFVTMNQLTMGPAGMKTNTIVHAKDGEVGKMADTMRVRQTQRTLDMQRTQAREATVSDQPFICITFNL